MFFSQYFRFPLSVSFHHCSILNHPFTTHAVKYSSPSNSVYPCQYHSTIAPYLFIYHPRCIMFFSQYFSFPPFSTIPPLLHTHSSIYHPRFKMFFSLYFSFPLSVPFHHCSILFHPFPRTLYNVFLPVLQFSP